MGTSIKQKYCSLRIADRKISYGMEISHRGFLSFLGVGVDVPVEVYLIFLAWMPLNAVLGKA